MMRRVGIQLGACAVAVALSGGFATAANPTAEQALKLAPVQKGVECDRPAAEEAAKSKIYAKKIEGRVGWVVESPDGQILRRFVDTNGDNTVDLWSYFKDGLEVYRDMDANHDGKVDNCRWFHTGGSRWGVDKDQDGIIDSWKAISAEEAAAEAVAALATNDAPRFTRLLPAASELKALGLGESRGAQLREKIARTTEDFGRIAGQQKALAADARGLQFTGATPGVAPAGTEGSTADVMVYENASVIAESAGKHVQVQLGALVRCGEAWRLIDAPQPLPDGQAEANMPSVFFHAASTARARAASSVGNKQLQDLMDELQKLDQAVVQAKSAEEKAALHRKRADALERLSETAGAAQERDMWLRQLVDMVSAAVQENQYPDGIERLKQLYEKLARRNDQREAAGYVRYRQIFVDYVMKTQGGGADQGKLQDEWQKTLEQYVKEYPQSSETPEAMLQMAMYQEYNGSEAAAKQWYNRIAAEFGASAAARKAAGAVTRLEAVGKVLSFRGKGPGGETVDLAKYRGQVVLLQFWSTAYNPCKLDMPVLKELVSKYDGQFTVVSVSLDDRLEDLNGYLKSTRLPWPQIYETGGLDSRPANDLGIISLPTMLLLDQNGKVVNRSVRVADLEPELKKLFR